MIKLIFAADDVAAMRAELVGKDTEKCAVLFANHTIRQDGVVRLLVREMQFPTLEEYTRKGKLEAELTPEFVARVTKYARRENYSLIFVHSHPGTSAPTFSHTDDEGEKHLAAFLSHRHGKIVHAALVISEGGIRARILGSSEDVRVHSFGADYEVLYDPSERTAPISDNFDRQIRAFGHMGQITLQRLRVAIIGLGGTGSLIAQQLVHLGVRDFILIDPDILDSTNLNRVANATPADIGQPKVSIAQRYIQAHAKSSSVKTAQGDVTQLKIAQELQNADLIFGCTDSHGSRAVLQQISYQYMIPCIDMGVTITVKDNHITHIYGRVQLLAAGLACLTCDGLLDANEVRRDMMTEFERQADPYLRGAREPAPAVMSLNSTITSLATTMMLSVYTGIPVKGRHILYNAIASTIRTVQAQPKKNCIICSRAGSFARGDSWPILAREN